jgi:serine/threonine protein kinase
MANKQDIITAIKNLDLFLKIPELKGAKPRLNNNGSPFAFAGGFNMVFQLVHNAKKWAFRVWHVPMGENKDRYVAISKYLKNSKLLYFADFIYDENGLLVNGDLTDTIRMEWLNGILLKDYIEKHLNDKEKLESLANDFLEMTKTLRKAKISHGDLQEGNILIDDSGKIRLVDYDSICIPEIEGQKELVTGLKGYQHPSRFKNSKASLKADSFSELIIYLSILGIALKPELWEKYQVKDTCYLLFSETDFENIETSKIYSDLNGLSPLIDSLLTILKEYLLCAHYLDLKPITEDGNLFKLQVHNSFMFRWIYKDQYQRLDRSLAGRSHGW